MLITIFFQIKYQCSNKIKYRKIRINSWDTKKVFQRLPFYNTFMEKPEIKKLSNIKLLHELPFYDVVEKSSAFSGYAKTYKIEIVQ